MSQRPCQQLRAAGQLYGPPVDIGGRNYQVGDDILCLHKAQGRTVDTAHVLLDDAGHREMAYVMVSRHREAAHLYTATGPTLNDDGLHPTSNQLPGGPDHLSAALARSRQQALATHVQSPPRVVARGL